MSMHLAGPWLTTTGKTKKKKKYRNAEAAQKSRENQRTWEALKLKYKIKNEKYVFKPYKPEINPRLHEAQLYKSLNITNINTGNASLAVKKEYTGTAMIGVATMHKSNAIPVFSVEEAKDVSNMRR